MIKIPKSHVNISVCPSSRFGTEIYYDYCYLFNNGQYKHLGSINKRDDFIASYMMKANLNKNAIIPPSIIKKYNIKDD